MTDCITIASWMLVVVGVAIFGISCYYIYKDIKSPQYYYMGSGLRMLSMCWGIAIGLLLLLFGIVPYLKYLPCITIIP